MTSRAAIFWERLSLPDAASRTLAIMLSRAVEKRVSILHDETYILLLNVKGLDALKRDTKPVMIASNYVLLSLLFAEKFRYSDCLHLLNKRSF